MEISIFVLSLLTLMLYTQVQGQSGQSQQDELSILEIIDATAQLSEFAKVLRYPGLHQAFLNRSITLFIPTNDAMIKYKGLKNENLILNHMTNIAIMAHQLEESLVSLVTGSPPLWVTRRRSSLDGRALTFINQAEILQADIFARTVRGDQQILHVIDSVLEPLAPISLREAQFLVKLDAQKLLTKSTLYDLSGYRLRIFKEQAQNNQRIQMFGVAGQHTFFLPVDAAFEVNIQLTGYDYERNNHRDRPPSGPKIDKDLVDASVVESHIVPHRLLFTSNAPSDEYQSVAWLPDGVKVNVSLQAASFQITNDPAIINYDQRFKQNQETVIYNKYQSEDRPDDPVYDPKTFEAPVMVRSNTIEGDRTHPRGMVVARILKGNIPVRNGVVHLIDKPLMIVARTLFEYINEEGKRPGNRLSKFAKLLRDKGGKFAEALLEAKEGTILAPSNEALEKVDKERLDFIIGNDYLRAEMLGLHFVRDRIISTDHKIEASNDQTFSTPASLASNRVWFHFNPLDQKMTVAARGINATVVEKDIGTINGVIHVIDRVLGVPYQTIYERLSTDPQMSHMWSMLVQTRMDRLFSPPRNLTSSNRNNFLARTTKFTLVVPSNAAWEKAAMNFNKAYNTLIEGTFPQYTVGVLQRHMKIDNRAKGYTFEELSEMSRGSPSRSVPMVLGSLEFTQSGNFDLAAYKDSFVVMTEAENVRAQVVRPNIECLDGYIHLVDTVMIDDRPPWSVGGTAIIRKPPIVVIITSILSLKIMAFLK